MIEKSIEKGFEPLEDKLGAIEDKINTYQTKHLGQLKQYNSSVRS